MRIDCRVVNRHIKINYCEDVPSTGVRISEGNGQPFYYDFYFSSFQDFHKLIYYILENNTHEGFNDEKE